MTLATGVQPAISDFTTNGIDQPLTLTSHTASDYLQAVMHEPSMPAIWKAGRITGWMEALMENAPQTFKSFVFSQRITALQPMERREIVSRQKHRIQMNGREQESDEEAQETGGKR